MSDFLEIRCPSCDGVNLVARKDVGGVGVFRDCQSCDQPIFVSEGDAPPGVGIGAAEEPSMAGAGLRLRMPSGRVETLSAEAAEQGIQMGRILPWDLVSDGDGAFHPAREVAELRDLFLPTDRVARVSTRCENHPDAPPAGTCRQCGRSYCASCMETLIADDPRLCPACTGAVGAPDPRLLEKPPWEDPVTLARLPLQDEAWKLTLTAGVLLRLASLSPYVWPLALPALALFVDVAARAARGERRFALPADYGKLFERSLPFALLGVALAAPFGAIAFLVGPAARPFLQGPWSLFVLAYSPAAAALLLLGVAPARAVKPRAVARAVAALRERYLLLLLALLAVSVVVVMARTLASFLPGVDGLLASAALAYGAALSAFLVGWMAYMHRERLVTAI